MNRVISPLEGHKDPLKATDQTSRKSGDRRQVNNTAEEILNSACHRGVCIATFKRTREPGVQTSSTNDSHHPEWPTSIRYLLQWNTGFMRVPATENIIDLSYDQHPCSNIQKIHLPGLHQGHFQLLASGLWRRNDTIRYTVRGSYINVCFRNRS